MFRVPTHREGLLYRRGGLYIQPLVSYFWCPMSWFRYYTLSGTNRFPAEIWLPCFSYYQKELIKWNFVFIVYRKIFHCCPVSPAFKPVRLLYYKPEFPNTLYESIYIGKMIGKPFCFGIFFRDYSFGIVQTVIGVFSGYKKQTALFENAVFFKKSLLLLHHVIDAPRNHFVKIVGRQAGFLRGTFGDLRVRMFF